MTISFCEDLKLRKLMPIKLLLFLQLAGDMALNPFLTLHMKSLGISITEIAIQFAISPIATLISTPLIGLIADKIGNYKIMLFGSLLLAAFIGNLLLFVPQIKTASECSEAQELLQFTCPTNQNFNNSNSSINNRLSELETEDERDDLSFLSIPSCFENKPQKIYKQINRLGSELSSSSIHNYRFTKCMVKCNNHNLNANNKNENFYWSNSKGKKFNGLGYCLNSEEHDIQHCFALENNLTIPSEFSLDVSMHSKPLFLAENPQFENVILSIFFEDSNLNSTNENQNSLKYQTISCFSPKRNQCSIFCSINKETMLPSMQQKQVMNMNSHLFTFWMYLILRVCLVVTTTAEMSLLKAAILTMVNASDSEYGFQRVWSSIAVCIVPFITGVIMDKFINIGSIYSFSPCFYIYSGLKVIMAFVTLILNLDYTAPTTAIFSKLNRLARQFEVGIFLFYSIFNGSVLGFIETFIVWYMEELGATRTLIGFSFTLSAISGIPLNIFAGKIERKVGHIPIIIFTMFIFSFRLIGYSFSKNSYHVLFFEMFDGFTTTLSVVTFATYASKLSSTNLIATMQAAWSALYFSVGRSLGTFIGGFLIDNIGYKLTYQIFGFASIVAGLIYLFAYKVYLINKVRERDNLEKKNAPIINYQKNLDTIKSDKESVDFNFNNKIHDNLNTENLNNVYKSGKENFSFRFE